VDEGQSTMIYAVRNCIAYLALADVDFFYAPTSEAWIWMEFAGIGRAWQGEPENTQAKVNPYQEYSTGK
jgi:hypothetical protein